MKPPPGSRSRSAKKNPPGLLESSRHNIFKAETTGVVIGICVKHPGGPTRMRVTDIYIYIIYINIAMYM
jgi:hypothetical protein